MSNYTVTTNFAAKDALPSGNPAKLILGAQLTTEFANIATAIATKLDSTTAVTSIAGTANQVAASASTGAVTLSLPQNVVIPTPASGTALSATAVSGQYAAQFSAASGANGLFINAGALSSDAALRITNATGSANYFEIFGDGRGFLTPTGGGLSWNAAGNFVVAAPSSGSGLTVNGAAGQYAQQILASTTTGQSRGLIIQAGTNSSDVCVGFDNAAGSVAYLTIYGDGGVVVGAATGSDQGAGTINATGLYINGVALSTGAAATTGSFSAGTTGLSGATVACNWTKIGTAVTLYCAKPSSIVSSTTGFTLTGLPSAIQPTTAKYAACHTLLLNNSALANNLTALVSGSTVTLGITGAAAAWTASGNKNFADASNGAVFVWDTN